MQDSSSLGFANVDTTRLHLMTFVCLLEELNLFHFYFCPQRVNGSQPAVSLRVWLHVCLFLLVFICCCFCAFNLRASYENCSKATAAARLLYNTPALFLSLCYRFLSICILLIPPCVHVCDLIYSFCFVCSVLELKRLIEQVVGMLSHSLRHI